MVRKSIPDAFMAFISLSSDSLPKVIKVASNTAIGTDSANIQARFKKRYSNITIKSYPLPRNLSIALNKKFTKRINVIIKREKIKGRISSLIKYLYSSLTSINYKYRIIYIVFLLDIN